MEDYGILELGRVSVTCKKIGTKTYGYGEGANRRGRPQVLSKAYLALEGPDRRSPGARCMPNSSTNVLNRLCPRIFHLDRRGAPEEAHAPLKSDEDGRRGREDVQGLRVRTLNGHSAWEWTTTSVAKL
jgi:hypothetical protein